MDPLQSALYSVMELWEMGRYSKKCNVIEMEQSQSSNSDQGLKSSSFGLIESLISVSASIGCASRSTENPSCRLLQRFGCPAVTPGNSN